MAHSDLFELIRSSGVSDRIKVPAISAMNEDLRALYSSCRLLFTRRFMKGWLAAFGSNGLRRTTIVSRIPSIEAVTGEAAFLLLVPRIHLKAQSSVSY